jgi:hypothetical protein
MRQHFLKRRTLSGIIGLLLLSGGIGLAMMMKSNVEVQFATSWIADPEYPNGGVIIGRGEGSHGIITVDIEPMTFIPEEPVQLTWQQVVSFHVTVENENGVEMHFRDRHIKTAAYLIEFTHDWGNDVIVQYQLRNLYEGN